ncbi:type 1 fimbrial protein [Salmonella enterica]|nr:type 1 fimbrial protein [Salmonella enterica]EFU0047640.1 type 1 fimbrial protein [Salmonella enterica]EFV5168714.1 type 1 fimbrial protein [Salmonella enterica]EGG3330678.1 type 1 fimbrial protein [Salmonella enterica]EKI7840699.1 type 1 fimbrial protein [Salmonella enterica]
MKSVKHLFLLGTAMAVMSSSAFADTTGTQTFTANVTANTCTIDNLSITKNLVDYTRAEIKNAGHDDKVLPGGFSHEFKVTNCPASVSNVAVTLTYNKFAAAPNKPIIDTTGTGKGVALWVYQGTTGSGSKNYWNSGVTKNFSISNGSGAATMHMIPYSWFPNGDSDIVAGSFTGVVNVSFDFT